MSTPRGLYGPNRDGLGDPDHATVAERHTTTPERLAVEHGRRRSLSPLVRALQAVTDRALRKG